MVTGGSPGLRLDTQWEQTDGEENHDQTQLGYSIETSGGVHEQMNKKAELQRQSQSPPHRCRQNK